MITIKFCCRYLSIFYIYSRQEGVNSVLNVKAVVAAFNQEKALVGAFSVITNLWMELFQALVATDRDDGGLLHHHVDADKTGEALFGVLQRWRLCWHYLW